VVGTHHQLEVGGTPHPVNATLLVAEALAAAVDAGVTPAGARERTVDASREGLVEAACGVLRLDAASLEALRAEAAAVVQALRPAAAER
jgi:hypothetical protein